MAALDSYDATAVAEAADLTISGIPSIAVSYTVHDIDGTLVASGSMSGGTVTIPGPGGAWQPGWYFCRFLSTVWDGVVGHTCDSLQISVLRTGLGLPQPPAAGTSPNAADPTGKGFDQYLHGFTVCGPQRWQIHDAATPTVTGGQENGGSIAALEADLALDIGAGGYSNPANADSARPRPQFVGFPNNFSSESGYHAGVAATTAALGPGTASDVEWFEGLNEPQVSYGLTPAQSAAQYNAFRAAVKAGNASAKALGPAESVYGPAGSVYGPQNPDLTTFLETITGGTLDGFSVHDYNGYNGDFIAWDGWLAATWAALEGAGYSRALPFFLTEIGNIVTNWQLFDPQRQVQWLAQLILTCERWSIPKEQIYWFYDYANQGFDPSWLKENTNDLRPHAVFYRVYSEEVFGKTYVSALDFGAIGDVFYRGNLYTGAGGTCVSLMVQGNPSDTVTLAISDPGPITVSDWQGQTSSLDVSDDGQVVVPIGHLPTYVRLSAGCTVDVIDAGNGLAGSPTNLALTATATSIAPGAQSVGLVNNGIFETHGYLPGPDFAYQSIVLPDAVTLEWDDPQTVQKLVIRQLAPWANVYATAMTEGKLEYWIGGSWVLMPTVPGNHWDARGRYSNPTATSELGQVGAAGYMVSFYDQHWCHNVDLSYPVTTTKVRWTVTETGYGHIPDIDAAAYAPFDFITLCVPQLSCSEFLVFQGDAETGGTVYAPVLA